MEQREERAAKRKAARQAKAWREDRDRRDAEASRIACAVTAANGQVGDGCMFTNGERGARRFFGSYGRTSNGVVMLTRADGWTRDEDGCAWFYIHAKGVESVRVAPTSAIPRIMGCDTWDALEEWCQEHADGFECCVAIVRMRSGEEHNVFGPAEDVASLIWGNVPCPP